MWRQGELLMDTLSLLLLCRSFSGGGPSKRSPHTTPICSCAPTAASMGHSSDALSMHSPFSSRGLDRMLPLPTPGSSSHALASAAPGDGLESVRNMDPAAALESAVQTVPEQQLEDALAACRIHRYVKV